MDRNNRIKVAILFGGRSPEHNISLLSAQNVYQSLDKTQFEPILIGIDKSGVWHLNDNDMQIAQGDNASQISMSNLSNPVLISQNTDKQGVVSALNQRKLSDIDVLFPVLHGAYGEDGSVQGLAKLADLPCVGCGILGSAIGMDKEIMKHVLRSNDIAVAKWVTVRQHNASIDYNETIEKLGQELFIKPANLGSSVGVSYSNDKASFEQGLSAALKYDPKVIIEEKIVGREIECAVLGNHSPQASIPGEIVPKHDFYSFESKYLDEKGAELLIPAPLSEEEVQRVKDMALNTYVALECRGMTRVDMFLTASGQLIINEVNTIPGFTNISMYPKLWEASGLTQSQLMTRLIQLAIQEHQALNKLSLT